MVIAKMRISYNTSLYNDFRLLLMLGFRVIKMWPLLKVRFSF